MRVGFRAHLLENAGRKAAVDGVRSGGGGTGVPQAAGEAKARLHQLAPSRFRGCQPVPPHGCAQRIFCRNCSRDPPGDFRRMLPRYPRGPQTNTRVGPESSHSRFFARTAQWMGGDGYGRLVRRVRNCRMITELVTDIFSTLTALDFFCSLLLRYLLKTLAQLTTMTQKGSRQ